MPESSDLTLSQIGQIAVNVHNLDRAVEFYRDKLGIKHLFTVPKMAFFACGDIRLMLAVPEKQEFDHPSSILYFKVGNIREANKTLAYRGVAFVREPQLVAQLATHDLWMAFFHDSEDNLHALMSEVEKK